MSPLDIHGSLMTYWGGIVTFLRGMKISSNSFNVCVKLVYAVSTHDDSRKSQFVLLKAFERALTPSVVIGLDSNVSGDLIFDLWSG